MNQRDQHLLGHLDCVGQPATRKVLEVVGHDNPRAGDECRFDAAINHAVINGSVLLGFTCLCAIEIPRYPAIEHGPGWLAIEVLLLIALGVGNYFGGEVIWGESPQAPLSGPPEPVSKNRAGH